MILFMRYLPVLALIIGLAVGYKIRDVSAERALAALQADFTTYQLKAAQMAAKAADDVLLRQQEQERANQEIERVKVERDQKVSVLERDLHARLRDVRLCHAKARTAPRLPQTDRSGADVDSGAGAPAELPASTAGDLVALAADADRIVVQLESCQDFAKSLQRR